MYIYCVIILNESSRIKTDYICLYKQGLFCIYNEQGVLIERCELNFMAFFKTIDLNRNYFSKKKKQQVKQIQKIP